MNIAESAMTKIEQLPDVGLQDEDDDGANYIWTRAYPKRYWNPVSIMLVVWQIIGSLHAKFDNTLKLETKSKGWMKGLIY